MTGVTTGQVALPTATESDNVPDYARGGLTTALQALANLFDSTTGHDHSGAGKGVPIGTAGIASGVTLSSPHFTSPVVDSGGLTVTAGNVGVGGTPSSAAGLWLRGSPAMTGGVTQFGALVQTTGDSGATTGVFSVFATPATAAVAFTSGTVAGFRATNPTKGAGSTITTASGLVVDAITSGNTNNIGVDVGTPSGGSGLNLSLRATGGVRLSGLGARVAGDVYVIVDANGDLHKSAIGPAS